MTATTIALGPAPMSEVEHRSALRHDFLLYSTVTGLVGLPLDEELGVGGGNEQCALLWHDQIHVHAVGCGYPADRAFQICVPQPHPVALG